MRRALLLVVWLLVATEASAASRSAIVRRAFLKATGYPHGRPGYIVDHIVPLCAGGSDVVANLQWQLRADAQVKDVAEKQLCARIRRDVAAFMTRFPRVEADRAALIH